MKKIEIIREEHIEEAVNGVVEVFKKEGYEITKDQAHCLRDLTYWGTGCGVSELTIKDYRGLYKVGE